MDEFIITRSQIDHIRDITRPASAKRKDRQEWLDAIEKMQARPVSSMQIDKKTILRFVELGFKLGGAKTFGGWIGADCELWETLERFGISGADLGREDEL